MLIVTPAASEALESLGAVHPIPPSGGVRLAYLPSRDGHLGISMRIVDQPEPQDDVIYESAVPLFLQPQASALLEDKVLDVDGAAESNGAPSFVLAIQEQTQA